MNNYVAEILGGPWPPPRPPPRTATVDQLPLVGVQWSSTLLLGSLVTVALSMVQL